MRSALRTHVILIYNSQREGQMRAERSNFTYIETTGQKATTLNKLELTSVYALLAYASHGQNVSEEILRETVN